MGMIPTTQVNINRNSSSTGKIPHVTPGTFILFFPVSGWATTKHVSLYIRRSLIQVLLSRASKGDIKDKSSWLIYFVSFFIPNINDLEKI